jgi:hypothetical protein
MLMAIAALTGTMAVKMSGIDVPVTAKLRDTESALLLFGEQF